MLIGLHALKSLNSIEKIQPRVMVATFNGNPSTKIISYYRLTTVSDKASLSITSFSPLFVAIPKHSILIIGEDMNAQIGINVNNKFSLQNSSNKNGEHLRDFTQENQ